MKLSSGPAPKPGEKWNLIELAESGCEFKSLIGTYQSSSSTAAQEPPPSLANLSLHFWHLKDRPDDQTPHKEDEAYLVLRGRGTIDVGGRRLELVRGDLVFVPRCVEHHFSNFESEGLDLLVIFSPNFTG